MRNLSTVDAKEIAIISKLGNSVLNVVNPHTIMVFVNFLKIRESARDTSPGISITVRRHVVRCLFTVVARGTRTGLVTKQHVQWLVDLRGREEVRNAKVDLGEWVLDVVHTAH